MDRALSDRRIGEIIGILLALVILCCMVSSQKIRRPSVEVAAGNSYISGEAAEETGDMFVIGGVNSDILSPASYPEYDISGKSMWMTTKVGGTVDFVESVEVVPASVETDKAVTSGEPIVAADEPVTVPSEPVAVPEEPIMDEEVSFIIHNGFVCDLSGKIIGCDGVSLTDGVLCLPFDGTCTGIAAGAFASLGGQVCEIYIPANITTIDAGAFDGLTELMYIEVHPDNPVYRSSYGILSEK